MSICLDIESYCQDCDGFEPKTRRVEMQDFDICVTHSETFVSCEHSRKCARMYEHIKREVSKSEC